MNEFVVYILSGLKPEHFAALLLVSYLGLVMNLLSDIVRRKPESETSPVKFSLDYWWHDNKFRILLSFISVSSLVLLTGSELDLTKALGIGLGADHVMEILKRKNLIKSYDNR